MKKFSAVLLCVILALCMCACAESGTESSEGSAGQIPDRDDGLILFEGSNLFKLTTAEDFSAGKMEGLELSDCGNGAVQLVPGATEGTFTSAEYRCCEYEKAVACWNALIEDGGSVEVFVRGRLAPSAPAETAAEAPANAAADTGKAAGAEQAPDPVETELPPAEEWTDWFTWGEFSPFIKRGSSEGKDGFGGYVDQDTLLFDDGFGDGFQIKAVLKRDSADIASPVLRQLTLTFDGGDMVRSYAENRMEDVPDSKLNTAPAYSQEVRCSAYADSICSPTTMTVLLNSRDPGLDLLPEEYAMNCYDMGEDIFGSWSFSTSLAGCYGFESYAQYADADILVQELAQGRICGLSVAYDKAHLDGAWGNTGGHLISLIGYEYEDGVHDEDHLYFYSSDSYSAKDCESYRRYKWTQLRDYDSSKVAYIIPSLEREIKTDARGVIRVNAAAEPAGDGKYRFLDEDGNQIELPDSISWEGCIGYTVDGIGTDMTADTYDGDYSVVYPNAMNVTANRTFSYLRPTSDGCVPFIPAQAYGKYGVDGGRITFFIITDHGYMYIAQIE